MSVLDFVLQLVLGVGLTAWVVRRDERTLVGERARRSWNDASFWSAVVAFGPLCIPVHFVRTRRSVLGLLLGLGWAIAVLGALSAVSAAMELVS